MSFLEECPPTRGFLLRVNGPLTILSHMRLAMVTLLFLSAAAANGAVYKIVNPDGTVSYSDRPQEGAEKVRVAPVQTYEAPNLPKLQPDAKAGEFAGYDVFKVVSPDDDQTFRDEGGVVKVRLSLSPGLHSDHTITIFMDGQDLGGKPRSTSLTLQNVDRGSHTIRAAVVDAGGKQMASTDPVTFHLHRTGSAPKAAPLSP